MGKQILVISGGGSDGAVTVGRLIALQRNYDVAIGISTGALLAPLALLGEHKRLAEMYTNLTQKSITETSVFKKNGMPNVPLIVYKALRSLITKEKSLGKSKALRQRIEDNYTLQDFNRLKKLTKKIHIGCYSLTCEELVWFNNVTSTFDDFKDWMWASANPPIVFSTLTKPRTENAIYEDWCDGGLASVVPVFKALEVANHGDIVDVFMHRPRLQRVEKKPLKNAFHTILRTFKALAKETAKKDLDFIHLAESKGISVNVYWQEYEINENSLVFIKKEMEKRIILGQKWANDETLIDRH